MIVIPISNDVYDVQETIDNITFTYRISKQEDRKCIIVFLTMKGKNYTSSTNNNLIKIEIRNHNNTQYRTIINDTFTVNDINSGISLGESINLFNYSDLGLIDLILSITINSEQHTFDFYNYTNEQFNIDPVGYDKPTIEILSIYGILTYDNIKYVNYDVPNNIINLTISKNEGTECNINKSYIELILRKRGYNDLKFGKKFINDDRERIEIKLSCSDVNYDNAELYIHYIREDNYGNKTENTEYLGYYYMLPRFDKGFVSVDNYNVTQEGNILPLMNSSSTVEIRLKYTWSAGYIQSIKFRIYKNGVLQFEEYSNSPDDNRIYNFEYDKEDTTAIYKVEIVPMFDEDTYSSVISSNNFKLLEFLKYNIQGNPIDYHNDNGKFDNLLIDNYTFGYEDYSTFNITDEENISVKTGFNYNELNSSFIINNVTCKLLIKSNNYSINKKLININQISIYYNTLYEIDNIKYYDLLSQLGVSSLDVSDKIYLVVCIKGTKNGYSFETYQYITRCLYTPVEPIRLYTHNTTINQYSFKISIDQDNKEELYDNHQNGILSGYRYKLIYNGSEIYDGYSSSNLPVISIPLSNIDGYVTIKFYYVYKETYNDVEYEYYSIYQQFYVKVKTIMTKDPIIMYPISDDSIHYNYSYLNKPYFLVFFRLPDLLDGTSGTASQGDAVYSEISITLSNDEESYSQEFLYTQNTDLFLGEFTYLENMILMFDAERLGITGIDSYTLSIKVRQNYGGIDQYGNEASVDITGYKYNSSEDRESMYNGVVTYSNYKIVYDIISGFIKSYSDHDSPTDPSVIVDEAISGEGKLINTDDFDKLYECTMRTINQVNYWVNEITLPQESNIKLIKDDFTFNTDKYSLISKSNNYIDQMYEWIQYIYNQYEYYPDEFLTADNPDGTLTIISYIGNRQKIFVPPSINGKVVTIIESTAFSYRDVRQVVIPVTVKQIN